MSKSNPDRTQVPPREQHGIVDPHEVDPQHGGPGHEDDGGESLLSGRSREDDAHEVEDVEPPQPPRRPK